MVGGISFADIGRTGPINLGAYRGSLGIIDYDNDGFYDVFINDNAGQPKRLFHNVVAPGVPGGTVLASLGLITGVLMFDNAGTALMLAIFALQDSFGTACNVTGDGALTLMLTGYAEKHGIADTGDLESPIL